MFRYPKMPGPSGARIEKCIAFEKLDGTNLHWEWQRDGGWFSFGTRSAAYPFLAAGFEEFAAAHRGLGEATAIFERDFAMPLGQILTSLPEVQHAVAFTEFLGERSFAGQHQEGDPKRLVLIDLFLHGSGFIDPWQFVKLLASLPIPRVVFQGRFTGKLTEDVRHGKLKVAEGVVVKGGHGDGVWMAKIKTNTFLEKLKQQFGTGWSEFWE